MMKRTLILLIVIVILSGIFHLGDGNSMALYDYEEMVRVVSRGVSKATGSKNMGNEIFTLKEATGFIANLPVK